MLKMKTSCERCTSKLSPASKAYICSYECTFCPNCAASMKAVCPNCDGELVARPTRTRGVIDVAASQLKKKIVGK